MLYRFWVGILGISVIPEVSNVVSLELETDDERDLRIMGG